MDNLKPCPICGGEAVLEEKAMGYSISCRKAYCVVFQMQRTDKASTILAWNTRSDDQRTVRLLDALECIKDRASNEPVIYALARTAIKEFKKGESPQ